MGLSKISFIESREIFHFHDYGRRGMVVRSCFLGLYLLGEPV